MADITIIMPSYNKERYIAEALDSVFMQKTSYDYHIVVADDCSTDRTIEIVKEYQNKYPNKITLLTSEKNQKLYRNVLRAYEITKTDYFCVLDPDDKWISSEHIQNALDFLENHSDYTIYSSHLIKKNEDGTEELVRISKKPAYSTFKDGLNLVAKIASTQSVVYRNVIFKNGIPQKMLNLESETQEKSFRGDTFRNYIHLHEGYAHYEPTTDAVYNITSEGIWTTLPEFEQYLLNANIFKDLWLYFDKKYIDLLYLSKKNYAKIYSKVFDYLDSMSSKEDLFRIIKNILELNRYYKEYAQDIVDLYNTKTKLKERLYYKIFEKLDKYLTRKGIVK